MGDPKVIHNVWVGKSMEGITIGSPLDEVRICRNSLAIEWELLWFPMISCCGAIKHYIEVEDSSGAYSFGQTWVRWTVQWVFSWISKVDVWGATCGVTQSVGFISSFYDDIIYLYIKKRERERDIYIYTHYIYIYICIYTLYSIYVYIYIYTYTDRCTYFQPFLGT